VARDDAGGGESLSRTDHSPGIAFAYQKQGFPRRLLAGRSARIVVTIGMPAFMCR
jgi:putative NADPH-quinone reductase